LGITKEFIISNFEFEKTDSILFVNPKSEIQNPQSDHQFHLANSFSISPDLTRWGKR
jgi:hypothetical protein